MNKSFVVKTPFPDFFTSLWAKYKGERELNRFDLEITARCNNNCRHCYISLPEKDQVIKQRELSLEAIKDIVDQAVSLGALECLLTGGEPLLREDFFGIYFYLKKKGILVSFFTNATLISEKHINFFKKYPPRNVEVTVYGIDKATYGRVTGRPDLFSSFMRGVELLLDNDIEVRFKAMVLRSNVKELPRIAEFCRQRTKDYFRFDSSLQLRFDGNPQRNEQIKAERLSPEEIAILDIADPERHRDLKKECNKLINPEFADEYKNCDHLFHCAVGSGSFTLTYDGFFLLCPSLNHPDLMYDLKKGSLSEACRILNAKARNMRSNRKEFLSRCRVCPLLNICMWCPAHAYLEVGELDSPVDYFCKTAHLRVEALNNKDICAKKT
ncbi:MAG: radical SAM protein [Candidatus Omnitrophota bacterium]